LAKSNLANGQQAWRFLNNLVYTSPSIYNNTIYTAAHNSLFAYDINGTMKWQTPLGQSDHKMYAPLVWDNTVYVVNSTKKLLAFNADNGSFKWYREQYNQHLLIANNSIFATDPNNRINCLDPATGDIKWSTENFVTFPFQFCVVDAKGNARHIAESGGQN
jgi:outer membrane protein assembly factor BamB